MLDEIKANTLPNAMPCTFVLLGRYVGRVQSLGEGRVVFVEDDHPEGEGEGTVFVGRARNCMILPAPTPQPPAATKQAAKRRKAR